MARLKIPHLSSKNQQSALRRWIAYLRRRGHAVNQWQCEAMAEALRTKHAKWQDIDHHIRSRVARPVRIRT